MEALLTALLSEFPGFAERGGVSPFHSREGTLLSHATSARISFLAYRVRMIAIKCIAS